VYRGAPPETRDGPGVPGRVPGRPGCQLWPSLSRPRLRPSCLRRRGYRRARNWMARPTPLSDVYLCARRRGRQSESESGRADAAGTRNMSRGSAIVVESSPSFCRFCLTLELCATDGRAKKGRREWPNSQQAIGPKRAICFRVRRRVSQTHFRAPVASLPHVPEIREPFSPVSIPFLSPPCAARRPRKPLSTRQSNQDQLHWFRLHAAGFPCHLPSPLV
jgi:hypothetical protein